MLSYLYIVLNYACMMIKLYGKIVSKFYYLLKMFKTNLVYAPEKLI